MKLTRLPEGRTRGPALVAPGARSRERPARLRAIRLGNPRLVSSALLLAIQWTAAPSRAAPPAIPAAATAEARPAAVHFDRGVTYYEEGDYSAALAEFKRAYDIAPSWRVLFNIGQAYFQLHEYVEALTTLRRFLAEGGDQIKPKRRAEVDAEVADLNNRVGYVTIESDLAQATVSIDDQPVGVTPIGEAIAVSAGVRRVTAQRSDHDPMERRISVVGGETTSVRFDFAPASPSPSEVTFVPSPAPAQAPGRAPNRVPALAGFGVAAAGLVASGVFGGLALYDKSRLDSMCASRSTCPTGARPIIDAMSRDALIANIALGVATVSAVTGVTLWLTLGSRPAPAGQPTESAHVQLGLGFVGGTF